MRNLIFILFLCFSLMGCFAGRKAKNTTETPNLGETSNERGGQTKFDWQKFFDDEKNDFYVHRLSAKVVRPTDESDGETGLLGYVDYIFTLELRHRSNNRSLRGFEFLIKSKLEGDELFNEEVTENNTLSWTERIEFDVQRPQADPVLVVKEIHSLGGALKGVAHAVFEINPWAVTESSIDGEFIDMTRQVGLLEARHPYYNPNFNYLAYFADPGQGVEPQVIIENARFFINQKETGTIASLISSYGGADYIRNRPLEAPAEDYSPSTMEEHYSGKHYNAPLPNFVERLDPMKGSEKAQAKERRAAGVKLKLSANLKLGKRYYIGNKVQFGKIQQGHFRVYAALLGSNQGLINASGKDEVVLIAPSVAPQTAKLENGILSVEFSMVASQLINRGDLELAVKVVPVKKLAATGLKPFGVIYKVGTYKDLGGFSGDFRTTSSADEDFDFDAYISKVRNFSEKYHDLLIDSGIKFEPEGIIFSDMNIRFRTVKAGETATQRTVIFTVKTCPTDGLTGQKVGFGRKFKIYVKGDDPLKGNTFDYKLLSDVRHDGSDGYAKVETTGCLAWTDEIAHKYYQREKLIDRQYKLVTDSGDEYVLTGYFNPWDEKYGTLGVDSRTISEEFIEEVREREKLPSRFFVGDFSYMTLRFRYNVDKDMKLTVKKTVLMNMYPFVKRYSNIINGINGNFPIRDGIYLLKLGYQKDFIDPGAEGVELTKSDEDEKSVKISLATRKSKSSSRGDDPFVQDDLRRQTNIHTTKKLIRVENNRVLTPIEFEIKDLRTLRIRSNLLIQLEPVNSYKIQIVNLFEKVIAEKLTLAIGNLNKMNCLDPGLKDSLLALFQKTLDDIAKAIPDDVNYRSIDDFQKVITSHKVVEALSQLTSHDLLNGVAKAFSLDLSKDQIHRAFKDFTTFELLEVDSKEEFEKNYEKIVKDNLLKSKSQVERQNRSVLGMLSRLASNARSLYRINTEKEDDPSLAPIGEPEDKLKPELRYNKVQNLYGSDETEVTKAIEALKEEQTESLKDPSTRAFLESLVGKEELETLLNNDFTIDPAVAKVSDLDLLIDRKAGIIRRTFVGPLTLLALDNKNTMNATDAIDYNVCSSDDCSGQRIKDAYGNDLNYSYARSPYFGYQGQFKNCHVDDFIIEEDQEEILSEAWTECVRGLPKRPSGEVLMPKAFSCDYTKTQAYQRNQSAFHRYNRHPDEKELENSGQCLYRDIWLKKYFAQKKTKLVKKQFANFFNHPSVTAKLLTPPKGDDQSQVVKVDALRESCASKKIISEKCLSYTKKFNFSADDFAKSFLTPNLELPMGSTEVKTQSKFKDLLIDFYTENKTTYENKTLENKDSKIKDLGRSIYKVFLNLAAPKDSYIEEERRLVKTEDADFGEDVQKFMCNTIGVLTFGKFRQDYAENVRAIREEKGVVLDKDLRIQKQMLLMNEISKAFRVCEKYAESESLDAPLPFDIERKFRVLETGRYFFRGGKSINFNTGQNVSVGHGTSWSNSAGLDPYNAVKDVAKSFVPKKAKGVVDGFLGGFKLTSYTKSENNSKGDGLSLATSTHLSMQAAQLDLELTRYRRCLLVRWNPNYLDRVLTGEKSEFLKKAFPALSNMFVCGGEETKPIAIRENYYYITQHFTEGDMLDSGSLLNNPWLLTLRGYRDMVAFVKALFPESYANVDKNLIHIMEDDISRLMDTTRPLFTSAKTTDHNERETTAGKELIAWQSMAKAYRGVSPTFPGLFTQLNSEEMSLPDWPWNQEVQIDKPEDRSCE